MNLRSQCKEESIDNFGIALWLRTCHARVIQSLPLALCQLQDVVTHESHPIARRLHVLGRILKACPAGGRFYGISKERGNRNEDRRGTEV